MANSELANREAAADRFVLFQETVLELISLDAPINSFKDLQVWQQGMNLSVEAYRLTTSFPKAEMFGLTSQIRRVAASVPANIAEGWGREGTRNSSSFCDSLKEA
jgi:hypothetical protein